jgi:hypothetical protein
MRRAVLAALLLVFSAGAGLSAEAWNRYVNARYGYGIDIPAGFSRISEAANGDGGVSRSADGKAELSVWGANLLLDTLRSDVEGRIQSASDDGWEIGYKKITQRWASWSGTRDGRIFYARAIALCADDQAGYFRIEYPEEQRDDFDAIVKRLVKGFARTDCQ